jgi:hypothetical protein
MRTQPRPQRLFARTAVAVVAAAAMVGGTGALALAHPAHPPHPAHPGHPESTSAHCKAERADLKAAKKDLAHAHRTGKPAKVEKAEDELKQQRTQASRWCSAAKSEAAATARAEEALTGWTAVATDPALAGLPSDLQAAIVTAATAAATEIQALSPQIAGASSPELAHLVNRLRSLDPVALQGALGDLGAALQGYAGDPTDLLAGVAAALGDFDAAGHPTHLQALTEAVQEAAAAITAGSPAPAP